MYVESEYQQGHEMISSLFRSCLQVRENSEEDVKEKRKQSLKKDKTFKK